MTTITTFNQSPRDKGGIEQSFNRLQAMTATDHFTHFCLRLIRGARYQRRGNKLQLALAIEGFRERARFAVEAVKMGDHDRARALASRCRTDWQIIRKWLNA